MNTDVKTETVSGNMPEKKFSTGAVSATVWQNEGKNKTGEPVNYRTISLQRSYKDKEGNWQSTSSLRINDLPRASLVLQKAYEYIAFNPLQNYQGQIEA